MTLEEEFQEARDVWRKETGHLSIMGLAQAHPAYQSVIMMGMPVVPIILRELEREPEHWMAALYAITGEDPVQERDWGRLTKMSAAWVEWGYMKGILTR